MKKSPSLYVMGYKKIVVKGDNPVAFLQACLDNQIAVWQIKIKNKEECTGIIRAQDYGKIMQQQKNLPVEVALIDEQGIPFLIKKLFHKKEIIIAILLASLFLFTLSNILWTVTIQGVSHETEAQINEQLEKYGIRPGSWLFTMDSPGLIQNQLLNDLPDLLWIGIDQKGTSLVIEGVEKIIIEKEDDPLPRNLLATKKGIIKRMFIEKGVPQVAVHDYVEPNDLLVSGVIRHDTGDEKNKGDEGIAEYVAATGEIHAETWYEVSVSVPFAGEWEQLTGLYQERYHVGIGDYLVPIWRKGKESFASTYEERSKKRLKFLKWELPIEIHKTTIREKVYNKIERSEEQAIAIGLEQTRRELKQILGTDTVIQSEKILQQSRDSGKVNLTLFITVEENITKEETITQGD